MTYQYIAVQLHLGQHWKNDLYCQGSCFHASPGKKSTSRRVLETALAKTAAHLQVASL